MKIRNKPLRDLCSIIFTVYYLFAAEQADEKVRKVRAVLTVDHLRVAWNKPTTPYLNFFTSLIRPRFTKYKPRRIRIPRPKQSHYKEPVVAWMYFNGTLADLEKQENVVLDIPGGGFVAMDPRTSDDKLFAWAGKTGLPILSLDYRKAPEYPYPYALNECFDVYTQIVATRGRCIGMKPDSCPRIVITGDSAGGNLACGTTLMVIQSNQSTTSRGLLPSPAGLVLLYPALDFNIGSWMTDDQMALIRNPRTAKKYERFIKRKSEDIDRKYTPTTPKPTSDDDDDDPNHDYFSTPRAEESTSHTRNNIERRTDAVDIEAQKQAVQTSKPQPLRTRLAVSSIISYFGDRILTPEMMRAMIILYVGPYNRPDFTTDHLLCPAVAPENLIAKFPKTYFLTGERDPLVDDTVIFAGRLRQAKLHLFRERQEVGLEKSSAEFNEKDHVEVTLIPGISHGFISFVSIFPEGWKHVFRAGSWIEDIFARPPHGFEGPSIEARASAALALRNGARRSILHQNHVGSGAGAADSTPALDLATTTATVEPASAGRHHSRRQTGESLDDDAPLVMSSLTPKDPSPQAQAQAGKYVNGSAANGRARQDGKEKSGSGSGSANAGMGRTKSLISLGSEEDLLKRRMKGLTVGLLGTEE